MKSGQISRFIVVFKFKFTKHPEGSSIASGTHSVKVDSPATR